MFSFALEQLNLSKDIMQDTDWHVPVMQAEVISSLNLKAGACFVDGTLGLGGHSRLIAAQLTAPEARLIGIDRDVESVAIAKRNLTGVPVRCDFVHDDFRRIDKILEQLGAPKIDGILLDLGISSFQIDKPERGFSIRAEGPLDMRMDQAGYISAYDLVNSLSEKEISSILKDYGEERMCKRIARFLVQQRSVKPIESTKELSDIVLRAMPAALRRQRIHPATRTFQAFRIAVNRELESLELFLERCVPYLNPGSRLCIISFHSLEDRIVKQKFRQYATQGQLRLITKKPLRPTEGEVTANPRARSARLRVAEKI